MGRGGRALAARLEVEPLLEEVLIGAGGVGEGRVLVVGLDEVLDDGARLGRGKYELKAQSGCPLTSHSVMPVLGSSMVGVLPLGFFCSYGSLCSSEKSQNLIS